MDDLRELVGEWKTLPDVAEELGLDVGKVRALVQDRQLVAARVGERKVLSVPGSLVAGGAVVPDLPGTLSVLADGGFSDTEAIRWLFTADEALGGTPVDALWAGRKHEIRRRAQALAL